MAASGSRGPAGESQRYDVILAGGGAAGLSLAYQLNRALPNLTMLIVDEQVKDRNDHTWCYWSAEPTYVDALAYRTWDSLALRSGTDQLKIDLAPYRYHMVRAIDFYRFMREALASRPGVQFLRGTIRDISDGHTPIGGRRPSTEFPVARSDAARESSGPDEDGGFAEVVVNGIAYRSTWLFDSRYRADEYRPLTRRYHYLIQHFLGWEIETEKAVFDPELPTMFDFRTPQHGAMRFFYVLPYAENQGLVEYTIFSADILPVDAYRRALRDYLAQTLGASRYRILEEERDLIPMTDHPHPRRAGRHVLNVGTRGGRVKPSSGYAFRRIQ
ncbi:MAG: hypothetical protein JXC32_06530, partial [Anaerolineae bacterium]|nr:hypothetical protein [Anaerolineae bacterium]